MLTIPNITIKAQIYESANSIVYRGIREQDNQPLILKVLKENYPTPQELARYRTEYNITKSLTIPGVVKAYNLQPYQNTLVIFLEDFGGESLKIWMQQRPFTILEFLQIAINTTEILGQIHAANIIHKDLNPTNIVFNPNTGEVKIIDFGISTQLTRENTTLKNPLVLEGTLAYMSPEQTGRMNRPLDYRSDFYSLGVTFYELLTRQLPFTTLDPLELVHSHIAKQPLSPNELKLEIPLVISDIVMKLLAKNAEDRYQSAIGIQADLAECLQQLQTHKNISNFPLSRQDISDKFQIPQKLYGREAEIDTLLTAFERVSSSQSELMLIAGYSGIGKSALVQELYKPITQKRGYFISGKFDQYQRNIPYRAVVIAFQKLIKQLLTETETQLDQWREKLLAAVGVNGQVIVEVIPEIELIIGKQPTVLELGSNESHNRFNLVFQNFIKVFTKSEHPLALFLDDLQWADGASLKLMQLLIGAATPGLFLIGAYRDNEVSAAHPLILIIDEIAKTGATINRISLSNLGLENVKQLISETIKDEKSNINYLAELVLFKTGGNPFFINEFMKSLYTENLLKFNFCNTKWQWDLEEIKARGFTDNVVELMTDKMQKLPDNTQNLLRIAACIGNQFDLKIVSEIASQTLGETVRNLYPAVAESLVVPLENMGYLQLSTIEIEIPFCTLPTSDSPSLEYRFVHDRIQQATSSLIWPEQKPHIHQQIGQLMLQKIPLEKREEKIFEMVNQLNFAIELENFSLSLTPNELADLNLIAGKKAKASAAYKSALDYLQIARKLLGEKGWEQQYDLTLALHIEAVEAAYLSGDFDLMAQLASAVLNCAKTLVEKVTVYEVKIQANIAQNHLLEAIQTALTVLKLLGIEFPDSPNQSYLQQVLAETASNLSDKQFDDLINWPPMTDPEKLIAMRLLARVASAAYIGLPELYAPIVLKQVNLSIAYGNTAISAYAYATYGLILCAVVGDINGGYQSGELAVRLLEKFDAKEFKAKIFNLVYFFVWVWKRHIRDALSPLLEGYQSGLETGDLEFAAYCVHNYCVLYYSTGHALSEVAKNMKTYSLAIRQIKQETALNFQEIIRQTVLNLTGVSEDPCRLMGEAYHEEFMLPKHKAANDQFAIAILYLNKMILSYLFDSVDAAWQNAIDGEKYKNALGGSLHFSTFYFYNSLIQLAAHPHQSEPEKQAILEKVAENQEKMAHWAHEAPINFAHKFSLVEAERYRIVDDRLQAMDLYDRAIELAKENDYIQEAAIAYELAAKFYLSKGKELTARAYMQEARYHYQLWGATAKIKHLEQQYPQLLTATQGTTKDTKTSASLTTTGSGLNLDIATIMKATSAISGEILLDKLLSNLMKILIENAGAQKGYLILTSHGNAGETPTLQIQAEGKIDSQQVTVLQSIPIANSQSLCEAIVNYVARTKESVVLNNATREGKFTNDSYIKQHHPKSILCVPLINQGQLISIVYLENNLTAGAFTSDRLEVLKLLSSQAAISIENAKLYAELRENESRLTQFLEAMPVGVGILDASGKPYYTNHVAQELLGKGTILDVTLGQIAEVYQLYKADTKQEYPSSELPIVRALRGEITSTDNLEIHQGDKIIPVESRAKPIYDKKGNIIYAITVFQNITERKKGELERQKFTEELFQLNKAYERFVPQQFLHFLSKSSIIDVKLGDQVQLEMSVLFSDIRDFTTVSEKMTPEDNFKFINSYLRRMEPAITENNGFIDKYIGDAIMALFSGEADNAVEAGISMLHRLIEYNQYRANSGYPPIQNGIGINTGSLMLGTVGGQNRMDGTVISDAVNLASRVESLTKNYDVSLLITEQTYSRLINPTNYAIRIIDTVKVKGKSQAVTVYEVFDPDLPKIKEGKLTTLPIFTEALSLYNQGKLADSARLFADCLQQNPGDRVAKIYLDRCQQS